MGKAAEARSRLDVGDDPTFYPTDDEMGENSLQRFITELLRPLVARFLAERGVQAFVGADQFIYWVQHAPTFCVAPDVYVMPGLPQQMAPRCWKVWEAGVVPSFALEVMAEDGRKDTTIAPIRYEQLGVSELVIFDPLVDEISGRTRFRVLRRDEAGTLVLAEVTNADRVWSEQLGCFLRVVGEGPALRLRLGTGPGGDALFPTEAEAERAGREAERAGREAAEAELAELRAELSRRSER